MDQSLIESVWTSDRELALRFREPLDYTFAGAILEDAFRILNVNHPKTLVIDLSSTEALDSAGIAVLRQLWRYCNRHHIELHYKALPATAGYFLRYVESAPPPPSRKPPITLTHLISRLGDRFLKAIDGRKESVRFVGNFIVASIGSISSIRHFRWRETLYYIQVCGSSAMPIIFVLNFLVGLVMAFQAAIQLRQFGANIYVADLVSLALTRELGPVFTALILAGRSGSAFAAEIGTMKVSEEIDALVVMGFDVTRFLILPKVFALAVCGPLLTLLANSAGIFGGILVGVLNLDLTVRSFIEEMYTALTLLDIFTGLIKSVVFAVLIALVGCLRGLQTGKGADSVGRQTTSAVVSGSFQVIFADAVFTVIFNALGW